MRSGCLYIKLASIEGKKRDVETIADELLNEIVSVGWPRVRKARVVAVSSSTKKIALKDDGSRDTTTLDSSDEFERNVNHLQERLVGVGSHCDLHQLNSFSLSQCHSAGHSIGRNSRDRTRCAIPLRWIHGRHSDQRIRCEKYFRFKFCDVIPRSFDCQKSGHIEWTQSSVCSRSTETGFDGLSSRQPNVLRSTGICDGQKCIEFNRTCHGWVNIEFECGTDLKWFCVLFSAYVHCEKEPDFTDAIETYEKSTKDESEKIVYREAAAAAQSIGISPKVLARLTGSVIVLMAKRGDSTKSSPRKNNVGLQLKPRNRVS